MAPDAPTVGTVEWALVNQWVRRAGRPDPEQEEEPLEVRGREAQLVEEDEDVDGDERPGDDGRATVRDGIADRDQVHAPGNARTPARCRCKGSAAVPVNWAALST